MRMMYYSVNDTKETGYPSRCHYEESNWSPSGRSITELCMWLNLMVYYNSGEWSSMNGNYVLFSEMMLGNTEYPSPAIRSRTRLSPSDYYCSDALPWDTKDVWELMLCYFVGSWDKHPAYCLVLNILSLVVEWESRILQWVTLRQSRKQDFLGYPSPPIRSWT